MQAYKVRAGYNLLKSFSQAASCVDEWYNTVLKQLCQCCYPKNVGILSRDIFLFGLQDQGFHAKCRSEVTKDLSAAKVGRWQKSWNVVSQL